MDTFKIDNFEVLGEVRIMKSKERIKGFLLSLLSRKFILSIIAAFVAFGNSFWGWDLSVEQVASIIIPLLGFVIVEGVGDVVERANK